MDAFKRTDVTWTSSYSIKDDLLLHYRSTFVIDVGDVLRIAALQGTHSLRSVDDMNLRAT